MHLHFEVAPSNKCFSLNSKFTDKKKPAEFSTLEDCLMMVKENIFLGKTIDP